MVLHQVDDPRVSPATYAAPKLLSAKSHPLNNTSLKQHKWFGRARLQPCRLPVSGAVDTRLGWDGSLFRRGGVRGRRFRLRSGLGTFALVVIVADPARVRLFAVATKFRAHRNPPRIGMYAAKKEGALSAGRPVGDRALPRLATNGPYTKSAPSATSDVTTERSLK